MRVMRAISVFVALGEASLCHAQSYQAAVDVSRGRVIENLHPPQPLVNAILTAVESSQRSSQENPAAAWFATFDGPDWIHVRFAPATRIWISGTGRDELIAVSEILISLPAGPAGRRWPYYVMLNTDLGVLSRAKWSGCEMREIVEQAGFDPSTEDPIYKDYCPTVDEERAAEAQLNVSAAPESQ